MTSVRAESSTDESGPLAGYRILDFTENMAGPFGTMILADQGADVVKIESLRGDPLRHMGTGSMLMGAYFANLNRSKRSLAIDLLRPESRAILDRLFDTADVVVQSFRPEAAERLGIDAPRARDRRSRLVHVSIVGFGSDGPLAGKPAYDHVIQALSGMAALQAARPETEPQLVRHGVVDKTTGHVVAQSTCAALLQRARTGEGAELVVSMLDVALHFLWPDGMMDKTALEPELRGPSASQTFRLTPTLDGAIALVVLTEVQWDALCAAIGADRDLSRGDVLRTARRRLETMATEDAVRLLQRHDLACAAVMELDDVPGHPQVLANESLGLYEHPAIGTLRQPNPVPTFADAGPGHLAPAPLLGEHAAPVLAEIGFDAQQVTEFANAGVIASEPSPATR